MTYIFNKASEKEIRRVLRHNMPKAEQALWLKLKGGQIQGFKFRRQYSIDHYIVDFYCVQARLVIEVDGDDHFESNIKQENDRVRQAAIERLGLRVLRVTNLDVYQNMNGVLEKIQHELSIPPLNPLTAKLSFAFARRGDPRRIQVSNAPLLSL